METNENMSSLETMRFFLMVSLWWTATYFIIGHLTLLSFFAILLAYPIAVGMDEFLREKQPVVKISTKISNIFMMFTYGLVCFSILPAIAAWIFHASTLYVIEAVATFMIVTVGSFIIRVSAFDIDSVNAIDAMTLSWLCPERQEGKESNLSVDMIVFSSVMMASSISAIITDAFHFENRFVWVAIFVVYMGTFVYLRANQTQKIHAIAS